MGLLTKLFGVPTYRWFTIVEKDEDLPKLYDNPFLQPFDVVYCKESSIYYGYRENLVYDENYNPTGEMEKGFEILSKGDQNRETINFFHKLNIGDTFTLKDKEEKEHTYTILNITYSLLVKDVSYTFVDNEKKDEPITQLVTVIDAKLSSEKPMQSLIFENEFK